MTDATLFASSNPSGIGTLGDKPLVTPIRTVVSASFRRLNNTTAYAANDIVSDSASVLIFSGMALGNGGSGRIVQAALVDDANQSTLGSFELALFTAAPAIQTDNALAAFTDAEMLTWIGNVPFSAGYVQNAGSGAAGNVGYLTRNLNLEYVCGSAETRLFGLLMVRNAYTPITQERFDIFLTVERFS